MPMHIIVKNTRTMDMTIDQQVALKEALVPHASRLRIGKSNFRLRLDITSKESTLQLVGEIRRLTDVNINKLHQPWRSFTAIINKCLSGKSIGYDSLRKFEAYKEYYAVATGAAPPKTKASVRKMKSSSDTIVTPPTAIVGIRLSTLQKENNQLKPLKQRVQMKELVLYQGFPMYLLKSLMNKFLRNQVMKKMMMMLMKEVMIKMMMLKMMMMMMIKMKGMMMTINMKESFDPITKTPKNSDDEGNDEENLGFNVDREEGQDEEDDEDELYRDSDRLRDEAQAENEEFFKNLDENIQKIIKEQVKEQVKVQVSKILPKIEKTVNEQLEAEVLTRSSNSSTTSYAVTAGLSEMELKKILIEKMEGNNFIHRSDEQRNLYKALVEAYESDKIILDIYEDIVTLKRRRDDDADKDEEPSAGSDRGSKRRREGKEPESTSAPREKATRTTGRSIQGSKSQQKTASESAPAEEPIELAKQADSRSSFNELIATPMDFSAFLMNRLKVDTLTPELLAGPTYEPMKGSYKSLVELEFFLEEVYKATTDQLDWNNPEGQQYPHNLLKPLPLIPNSRGRRVILFDHFINNDLEYLHGGAFSRKYTTSVTKTKAADYGHIKWIEDLVPRTIWSQESIVKWHNYKHLDWITMRRDDDKLYKFKEGNFKRLLIQDIEDMLLLLVQGKLTNLSVEERFAFNVSLRMFTRSIVIQRRVEDLQLGVESYQNKLNLTRPNMYRFNLKRKEAYTAYSNPSGFIYQNKDK
nr:hypothetical protein [Tanacetum cinerariifolium]